MSRTPVAAGEHAAWLLELGSAVRADRERPMLSGRIGAWSSRRARSRARRERIREWIVAAGAGEEVELVEVQESIDDTLRDRIGVYTIGDEGLTLAEAFSLSGSQPAVSGSLRSTATGPGLA